MSCIFIAVWRMNCDSVRKTAHMQIQHSYTSTYMQKICYDCVVWLAKLCACKKVGKFGLQKLACLCLRESTRLCACETNFPTFCLQNLLACWLAKLCACKKVGKIDSQNLLACLCLRESTRLCACKTCLLVGSLA